MTSQKSNPLLGHSSRMGDAMSVNADALGDRNEDSRMISEKGANEMDSPQKRSAFLEEKERMNSGVSTMLPLDPSVNGEANHG